MPGLKHAGLNKFGYTPSTKNPSLWRHATRNIFFSLVVNDFGVKYVDKTNTNHPISALQELYTVSTDWKGTLFCGLTLNLELHRRMG